MKIGLLKKIAAGALAAAALVFAGGCSSAPQSVNLTANDYDVMARSCLEQIYRTGVFDDFEETPKIKVSRIIDRTSDGVQTTWITDVIITELNRNGKVVALSEDAYAQEMQQHKDLLSGEGFLDDESANEFPDITLSGNIREKSDRLGRTVEKTYRLTLDLNKDGKKINSFWHEVKKVRTY